MSQYSQQPYPQGQQSAPQYRGPTPSQQVPSQYGASESAPYTGQQAASQYSGPDASSYGPQASSAEYGAQEQGQQGAFQYESSQPQYGEQQVQDTGLQQDTQIPDMEQEEPVQQSQYGQHQDTASWEAAPNVKQHPSSSQQKSNGVNGAHNHNTEHHDAKPGMKPNDLAGPKYIPNKSMVKPHTTGPVQQHQPQQPTHGSQRNYDPSHHNALYHMGQAAGKFRSSKLSFRLLISTSGNGFTTEHIDSFLHLGTYALGALANTHNLAPAAPHPGY